MTFDIEIWPFSHIAWWKCVAIHVHPSYKITLPLAIPSWSYSRKMAYCIRQYFRVQIFSRIWPKFLHILSSREFNFAILVVLSLVQIDMNQSENFRDKWFAKLNHREIYPVYSNLVWGWWPLTLNCDPSLLLFYKIIFFLHVNPSHHISLPLNNVASRRYGRKVSFLAKVSLGQVWTKSTQGFSFNQRELGGTDGRTIRKHNAFHHSGVEA